MERCATNRAYYTYVLLDTRKPGEYIYYNDEFKITFKFSYEPFYVGKGHGDRISKHRKEKLSNTDNIYKFRKISKIKEETGNFPIEYFVKTGFTTEKEAYDFEEKMVFTIGRVDLKTGPLTNLNGGGTGGNSYMAKEVREKISNSLKGKMVGEKNAFYGKTHTEETKQKLHKINIGKKASKETRLKQSNSHKGENNSFFGKTHTNESREKIAKKAMGRKMSEEHKQKLSKVNTGNKYNLGRKASEDTKKKLSLKKSGENHPFYGKHHSEDTKKKISLKNSGENNSRFGIPHSQETRNKIGNAQKGEKNHNFGKKASQEVRDKMSSTRSRKYKLISPDGLKYIVCGLKNDKIIKEFDLNSSSLLKVSKGKFSVSNIYKGGWGCIKL